MTSYMISDPQKPWLTLFSSARLEAVAEALAAQSQLELAGLYATRDGLPRALSKAERIELLEAVLKLRPGDAIATAELTAARLERSDVVEP